MKYTVPSVALGQPKLCSSIDNSGSRLGRLGEETNGAPTATHALLGMS